MLVQKVNTKEFIKQFKKSFENFVRTAPILISFALTESKVDIYQIVEPEPGEVSYKKLFEYIFDFSSDVKQNIFEIKRSLLEYYPVFIQEVHQTITMSASDLHKKVNEEGIDFDDLDVMEDVKKAVMWRVEKILVTRDELFIRNLETNKYYRYKMSMPVTIFLKKLLRIPVLETFNYFETKSRLLNEIYKDYNTREDRGNLI